MPHQFMSINCKKCDEHYCPVCHKFCPKCGEFDKADDNIMVMRSAMRLKIKEKDCDMNNLLKMKLGQIADVIFDDWKDISPNALPYVTAMLSLDSINDSFGSDDAESVVSYFIINSVQWRGDTARAVKKYLRDLIATLQENRE